MRGLLVPSGVGFLALTLSAAGCATTREDAAVPDGPQRVFDESGPTRGAAPRPDANLPALMVDGAPGVVGLCDALRDTANVSFPGNEVEQARAREQHRSKRAEAIGGRYVVEIPARGYAFGAYDLEENMLAVPGGRFALGDGAELFTADSTSSLRFALGAAQAERVLKMHGDGSLNLRVVFRPALSQMREDLCMRLGGGIAKLSVEVLAGYLVGPAGAPLARYETQEFAQVMGSVRPVDAPGVTIAEVMSAEGGSIPTSVSRSSRQLVPPLLACYRRTLSDRPGVRGKIVLRADLGKDGKLHKSKMEVSSVGDEALVACCIKAINGSTLAIIEKPQAVFVPITFGSDNEAPE